MDPGQCPTATHKNLEWDIGLQVVLTEVLQSQGGRKQKTTTNEASFSVISDA